MEISVELDTCLAAYQSGELPAAEIEQAATLQVLAVLKRKAPGKSVELRIPPHGAIQLVAGVNHRRGTPSAVVEMSARSLIQLALGISGWDSEVRNGTVIASGERSNLSALFPC